MAGKHVGAVYAHNYSLTNVSQFWDPRQTRLYAVGREARANGELATANPFVLAENPQDYYAWDGGWQFGLAIEHKYETATDGSTQQGTVSVADLVICVEGRGWTVTDWQAGPGGWLDVEGTGGNIFRVTVAQVMACSQGGTPDPIWNDVIECANQQADNIEGWDGCEPPQDDD